MRIKHFVNGQLLGLSQLELAKSLAFYLRGRGWQVLELYAINMLILFTPGYGKSHNGKSKKDGNVL